MNSMRIYMPFLNKKTGTKSRNENEHYKLGRFTLDAKHATLYNDETEKKRC